MNTKKITKNSERKQTIHIDELLKNKQNYQACQDFSVDEQLQAKLSNIPYAQAKIQQHAQQQVQQQDRQKIHQANAVSFWKTIKRYFSRFQWHIQPRYAMLTVGILLVGILWYVWFDPQTPLSEETVYYDVVPFSAVNYAAEEYQDTEYGDIQPVMMQGETYNDCDWVDGETKMDSWSTALRDNASQEWQWHIQEKHENKENQKKMKENIFSAVLRYVVKLLFFSL